MTKFKTEKEILKSRNIKRYEDLTISDDFMFGIIMRQSEYCKPFLETVLGIKIDHIEYPKIQEVIDLDVKAKSIRLDVYIDDCDNTVYNIEMQNVSKPDQPKRMRYYQDLIDLDLIEKGQDYNELKTLLDFIDGNDPEDAFTRKLAVAVDDARLSKKWRVQYMNLQLAYLDKLNEGKEIGIEMGKEIGKEIGIAMGKEMGKKTGFEEAKTENAKRMLNANKFSLEDISYFSGLSIDEVKKLQAQIDK